jgi:hypothetical protein
LRSATPAPAARWEVASLPPPAAVLAGAGGSKLDSAANVDAPPSAPWWLACGGSCWLGKEGCGDDCDDEDGGDCPCGCTGSGEGVELASPVALKSHAAARLLLPGEDVGAAGATGSSCCSADGPSPALPKSFPKKPLLELVAPFSFRFAGEAAVDTSKGCGCGWGCDSGSDRCPAVPTGSGVGSSSATRCTRTFGRREAFGLSCCDRKLARHDTAFSSARVFGCGGASAPLFAAAPTLLQVGPDFGAGDGLPRSLGQPIMVTRSSRNSDASVATVGKSSSKTRPENATVAKNQNQNQNQTPKNPDVGNKSKVWSQKSRRLEPTSRN